jgi:predicted nucleotidyltransferase
MCIACAIVCHQIEEVIAMQKQTNLADLMEILRQQLPQLAERYQVRTLGVFGSYVRQEQQAESDLDVLITFYEPPSLLEFIKLENYLTDLLGVKVDLVMQSALKPRIGERILNEVVPV